MIKIYFDVNPDYFLGVVLVKKCCNNKISDCQSPDCRSRGAPDRGSIFTLHRVDGATENDLTYGPHY